MFNRALMACLLAGLLFGAPANAETHRGIGPYYTPNDVKAIFPAATFERLKLAWCSREQFAYQISGAGIDGSILVFFYDYHLKDNVSNFEKEFYGDVLGVYYAGSEEKGSIVDHVRWAPSYPIDVATAKAVYGPKTTTGVDKTNFTRYIQWPSRGVIGYLTSNGRVAYFSYSFTSKEIGNRMGSLYAKYYLKKAKEDRERALEAKEQAAMAKRAEKVKLAKVTFSGKDQPKVGDIAIHWLYWNGTHSWYKARWTGDHWKPLDGAVTEDLPAPEEPASESSESDGAVAESSAAPPSATIDVPEAEDDETPPKLGEVRYRYVQRDATTSDWVKCRWNGEEWVPLDE